MSFSIHYIGVTGNRYFNTNQPTLALFLANEAAEAALDVNDVVALSDLQAYRLMQFPATQATSYAQLSSGDAAKIFSELGTFRGPYVVGTAYLKNDLVSIDAEVNAPSQLFQWQRTAIAFSVEHDTEAGYLVKLIDNTPLVNFLNAQLAAAQAAQVAAENAQAGAEQAEANAGDSEANANTAKVAAEAAQTAAESAQTASEQFSDTSEAWANTAPGTLIPAENGGDGVDDYSSRHFAAAAEVSRYAAENAETQALDAQGSAEAAYLQSQAQAEASEAWAQTAEDTLVPASAGGDEVDDYSALHWAKKAEASADVATLFAPSFGSPPATITSTGTQSERRVDGNYMYICVAANSWRRIPLLAW